MSQRLAAKASVWRFSFARGGLRGKGVGRAAITYSIFTLDPPRANAHSHRTRSNFASEEYRVHLRMQQQNASAAKFLALLNATPLILLTNDSPAVECGGLVYPDPCGAAALATNPQQPIPPAHLVRNAPASSFQAAQPPVLNSRVRFDRYFQSSGASSNETRSLPDHRDLPRHPPPRSPRPKAAHPAPPHHDRRLIPNPRNLRPPAKPRRPIRRLHRKNPLAEGRQVRRAHLDRPHLHRRRRRHPHDRRRRLFLPPALESRRQVSRLPLRPQRRQGASLAPQPLRR